MGAGWSQTPCYRKGHCGQLLATDQLGALGKAVYLPEPQFSPSGKWECSWCHSRGPSECFITRGLALLGLPVLLGEPRGAVWWEHGDRASPLSSSGPASLCVWSKQHLVGVCYCWSTVLLRQEGVSGI